MTTVSPKSLKFKMLREGFVFMQTKMEGTYTLMIGSNFWIIKGEFATLVSKQGLLLSQ